jgi:hypothetical protein
MSKTADAVRGDGKGDFGLRVLVLEDKRKGPMTNEQLGAFTRRTGEIRRRIEDGALPFGRVMEQLQAVAEANVTIKPMKFGNWDDTPESIQAREQQEEDARWGMLYRSVYRAVTDRSEITEITHLQLSSVMNIVRMELQKLRGSSVVTE